MKRKIIRLILVAFVPLVFAFIVTNHSGAGESKENRVERAGDTYSVTVKDVEDTDKIYFIVDSKTVTIRLANVMPFSKWPGDLTADEKAIKEAGIKLLKEYVTEKKVDETDSMMFRGEISSDKFYGDLTLGSVAKWKPREGPAANAGWGFTHINVLLIQSGSTLYQREEPKGKSPGVDFGMAKERRDEWLEEAEAIAHKNKLGIWKNEGLVAKLKAAAKEVGK